MRSLTLFALIALFGAGTAAGADFTIRRLAPSAFPQLPPSIRQTLEHRGCLVPQLWEGWNSKPHNVIRGAFLRKKQIDWAVLCSIAGRSTILVFPRGASQPAAELAAADDENFVQEVMPGRSGFSRAIGAVGRKHILEFYEAYGGPKPPPMDHQGINDAFVEKASGVHYFYKGEWLELSGAD
jgi:hypothetical protein